MLDDYKTKVEITFSEPMDTESVGAAIANSDLSTSQGSDDPVNESNWNAGHTILKAWFEVPASEGEGIWV